MYVCRNDAGSIPHLFLECKKIQNLYTLTLDLCQTILWECIQMNGFIKIVLFGYFTIKPKNFHNLITFVLSNYRTSIWSTRSWCKNGRRVNLRCIFRSFIKKRINLEFQGHVQNDSMDVFLTPLVLMRHLSTQL